MKKRLLCLCLIAGFSYGDCNLTPEHLKATYSIVIRDFHGEQTKQLTLWRQGKEVVHELDNGTSEAWDYQSDQLAKPIRLFDDYQRGVEYQAADVGNNYPGLWHEKNQLLSSELLARMEQTQAPDDSCLQTSQYQFKNQQQSLKVDWHESLNLPESFVVQNGTKISKWTLEELSFDQAEISSKFANWHSYYLTDYADIGDNESDPFLMNMINLGFISHGASGFYRADGQALQGGHSH